MDFLLSASSKCSAEPPQEPPEEPRGHQIWSRREGKRSRSRAWAFWGDWSCRLGMGVMFSGLSCWRYPCAQSTDITWLDDFQKLLCPDPQTLHRAGMFSGFFLFLFILGGRKQFECLKVWNRLTVQIKTFPCEVFFFFLFHMNVFLFGPAGNNN